MQQQVTTTIALTETVEGVIDSHAPGLRVRLVPRDGTSARAEFDGEKTLARGEYQVRLDGEPTHLIGIRV